jgi:hypothetical protein
MLEIPSPGGCEEALRIIAKRSDVDFSALSEKFCIRVVGPMLLEGSNPTIPPPVLEKFPLNPNFSLAST